MESKPTKCTLKRHLGFSLSRPRILKNWKSEIPPRGRRARERLGAATFRAGLGVGMPRAKRRETPRIWRTGAARRAGVTAPGGVDSGCRRGGAAEFQVFRISESGHSGLDP
jgi:hypothetical protein